MEALIEISMKVEAGQAVENTFADGSLRPSSQPSPPCRAHSPEYGTAVALAGDMSPEFPTPPDAGEGANTNALVESPLAHQRERVRAAVQTVSEQSTPEKSASLVDEDAQASSTPNPHTTYWHTYLKDCGELIGLAEPMQVSGRLTRVTGLVLEAVGLKLPLGCACHIPLANGARVEAEVVGFHGDKVFLMPQSEVDGVIPGSRVFPVEIVESLPKAGQVKHPRRRPSDRTRHLPVGFELLGRVLDAAGRPLDQLGPLLSTQGAPLNKRPINPLSRAPIEEVLEVGVRVIDSLLTVGRGQRMGLFAGSGVGKSVLLGMMARYTSADVIVVGLIGERGREVKEFIEQILGSEGLSRSVVVAAPADTPALMRLQGAAYATSIAEHFRDQGLNVLLIMDSLTRYAMAQREIALAIGEPPATKGYPPSVFAKLPALVERTGNGASGSGSITAFYTVLTEGDDQQDPIADAARAILDGHIVLSRSLAESGHYPAVDIEQSISRVMHHITTPDQQQLTRRLKQLVSRYQRSRDLISVGAYVSGTDPLLDEAIALFPRIERFLQQNMEERVQRADGLEQLADLFNS